MKQSIPHSTLEITVLNQLFLLCPVYKEQRTILVGTINDIIPEYTVLVYWSIQCYWKERL